MCTGLLLNVHALNYYGNESIYASLKYRYDYLKQQR